MVDEVASHLAPTVYPYLLGRRTTLTTQVDEVASNLVCSGARTHRRKLVRALLQPPRHRPEVLPHYARLAATLSLCFKHVDTELASLLKEEVTLTRTRTRTLRRR